MPISVPCLLRSKLRRLPWWHSVGTGTHSGALAAGRRPVGLPDRSPVWVGQQQGCVGRWVDVGVRPELGACSAANGLCNRAAPLPPSAATPTGWVPGLVAAFPVTPPAGAGRTPWAVGLFGAPGRGAGFVCAASLQASGGPRLPVSPFCRRSCRWTEARGSGSFPNLARWTLVRSRGEPGLAPRTPRWPAGFVGRLRRRLRVIFRGSAPARASPASSPSFQWRLRPAGWPLAAAGPLPSWAAGRAGAAGGDALHQGSE